MKTPLLLLFLAGGSLACFAADAASPVVSPSFTWVDPADPAVAAVRQAGEQSISRVAIMLIYEVERGIAADGLAKTIETVHLKNLVLPKLAPGLPRVTAVKRTSLGLRNPANLPDAADSAALAKIDAAIKDGMDVPTLLIQRLEPVAAPVEWRVYRPITTQPVCLNCHGPRTELRPEVREFLAKHYPTDNAADYSAYQWRGVIRISLAADATAKAK
jgi:hypothetical protein